MTSDGRRPDHAALVRTIQSVWATELDSPAAAPSPERSVAHVALDGLEFCQLAAGHVPPEEAAAGQDGDREAIHDVLAAAAALSRL